MDVDLLGNSARRSEAAGAAAPAFVRWLPPYRRSSSALADAIEAAASRGPVPGALLDARSEGGQGGQPPPCSSWLEAYLEESLQTGVRPVTSCVGIQVWSGYWHSACRCKDRWCLLRLQSRSRELQKRLTARLAYWEPLPCTMLTVTLGPEARSESEREQLDWLHKSLAVFLRRLKLSGFYAVEATWTKRGMNLHAHVLLLGAFYVKLGSLRELLNDCMLGHVCFMSKPRRSLSARSGAAYLSKYVTKTGAAMPRTWRGRRLFGSFGSAWGAPWKLRSATKRTVEVEYEAYNGISVPRGGV